MRAGRRAEKKIAALRYLATRLLPREMARVEKSIARLGLSAMTTRESKLRVVRVLRLVGAAGNWFVLDA